MYLPSTSNDPENFSFSSLPVQQKTTSKAFSLSRTPPSDRDENQKSVLQFCSHPSGRHPAKISSRTSVGKYSVPAIFRAAMLTFLACIVKRTINGVELLLLLNSFTFTRAQAPSPTSQMRGTPPTFWIPLNFSYY